MGVTLSEIAKWRRSFQRQVTVDRYGCWIRPDSPRSPDGHDQQYKRAWKLWHGPKPVYPYEIDHTCGRGREGCINPFHLAKVTKAENLSRRFTRQKRQMPRARLRVAKMLHNAVITGLPKPEAFRNMRRD